MRSDDLRKIVNTIWRMFGIVLLVGALPNLALGIGFAIEELSCSDAPSPRPGSSSSARPSGRTAGRRCTAQSS
ncbi:MAG: hypothetical protein AAFU70_04985, partial [Planctomycetota bacterium]